MMYPFSIGDLVCSAAVLRNYMESAPQKVPWADLRYLFGEIMYGGHIVNDFDRLLATTYLEFYMRDDLLDEMLLYPFPDKDATDSFKAPPTSILYDHISDHIDDTLKTETPLAFGLHPNAEIGFRTQISETLLSTILDLTTTSDHGSGDGDNSQMMVEVLLQDIMDVYREVNFDIDGIARGLEEVGPFQNVVLQECERMNTLVFEMVRSLAELDLGFRGDLTMTEAMEDLASSLTLDRVPKVWVTLAYPSLRPLSLWLQDLQSRLTQVNDWSGNPSDTPIVTWISGLFNPQSYLTAVMQATAQANGYELDKLTLLTEVTKKVTQEEVTSPAKDGSFITGICLEGASWNVQASLLEPSKPREMYSPLPVINIRPVMSEKSDHGVYLCPVYKTQQRGPTYVFSMQLKTKHEPGKWVLAGAVGIMDVI